ncbi:hypothetical protein FA95DRAFT_1506271 [Auriscalpium vulgare]|uniref:Uncharacterized protein n=2 Tax=Auriscalpium vulgare TaxID=40419 RepID=A0ACB8R1E4_9AGAM|nr:hypothetical protein FA95DRAFT_1506282 [Auriscalpium vulgare]KAI0037946.1 hypothetical protein FA95DRAFT_1506271 [Auriscalpium vulgare]
MFYRGLKDEVKDLLVGLHEPTVFNEYVALSIMADNRVHRRALEKKQDSGKGKGKQTPIATARPSQSSSFSNASPASSSNAPTPRAPLTQEEKDRRRREGLCLYCGLGKHLISNCPNMSERAKKNYAARAPASSSSGKA